MNAPAFKGIDAGVNRGPELTSSRECKYGHMKYLTTDYGVGQQLALYGEYSEGEVVLFRKLIRHGDIVISAGGNIGAHLVPLSQIVGGDGIVYTFEPQPFLLPILRENLKVNGCDRNVVVFESALGAEEGFAGLETNTPTMPNNFGGMGLTTAPVKTERVKVMTIDSLELIRLDFLMLDVEGAEQDVLRGAAKTIERCRPYLYVEVDKEDKREPLVHFIKYDLGYEILQHLPFVFNPDNFARNPKNHFPNQRAIMCLAIPK